MRLLLLTIVLCISSLSRGDYAVVIQKHSAILDDVASDIISKIDNQKGIVLDINEFNASNKNKFELIVTVGEHPLSAVNDNISLQQTAVLSTFIPRSAFKAAPNRAAIFNDINLSIHTKLLSLIFKDRKADIGLFHAGGYPDLENEIHRINNETVLNIIPYKLSPGENPEKIIRSYAKLNEIDAFIIMPSPNIYNTNNLSSILYALYQHKIAAVGYSKGLVDNGVGAVIAAYFTKEQIIYTAQTTIKDFYTKGRFEKHIQTPGIANIAVNNRLAKSLDINLDHIDALNGVINE
ncbi:MAG TPA: hypothetical protein ENH82_20530 [bacterium]|nr:hypothetical protein [bacterium]